MHKGKKLPKTVEDPLEGRIQNVRRKRNWKSLLFRLLITALIVYLTFGVFFGVAVVKGDSMTPTLENGDLIFFQRIGVTYQTGDVVLVKMENGTEYVKRIVALPGQTVDVSPSTGGLLVDGEPLQESYIYEDTYGKDNISYPLTLGVGEYFVLGDHRENSMDSRNYGAVASSQLDGRLLLLFFRWQG